MRQLVHTFSAILLLATSTLVSGCSGETDAVIKLVKDKIQLESEGDVEGLWLLHSPAYLNECSYDNFAAYQTRKTAELRECLGEGDLHTTVIEAEIIGDVARVRYEIAAEGSEDRGFAIWDCFFKKDGIWYDIAENSFDPGYNEADDYIVVSAIGVSYHYVLLQASEQDGVLTLTNPYVSLNQSTLYEIDNAPRTETGAIKLNNSESIRISGPPISSSANMSIDNLLVPGYPYTEEVYLEGYKIDINPALTYKIAIGGFDGALELASVELVKGNSNISSSFILTCSPWYNGMINISVISVLDKTELDQTSPIPIEVNTGCCCQ